MEERAFRPEPKHDYPEYPELQKGLDSLSEIDQQRAKIAYLAAKHIIESNNGETLDLGLYYAAMFGKDYRQGWQEDDIKLILPGAIIQDVSKPVREGQPIIIRDINIPEYNIKVGILESFSDERYQPTKFSAKWVYNRPEYGNYCWEGSLNVAIREVVPTGSRKYKLEDEVKSIRMCKTDATLHQQAGYRDNFETSKYLSDIVGGDIETHRQTDIWRAGLKAFHNIEWGDSSGVSELRWLAKHMRVKLPIPAKVVFSEQF